MNGSVCIVKERKADGILIANDKTNFTKSYSITYMAHNFKVNLFISFTIKVIYMDL